MKQISIIIPIYNMESYIEEAITSVQRQTLKELEIICVDDGSTDGTVGLLERLAKEDSRIRLFKQEHQGPGQARNMGIQKAEGEFVAFLDADDFYLDEEALADMCALCREKGTEICAARRKNLIDGTLRESTNGKLLADDVRHGDVLRYRDFQMDYDYVTYIFRRRFLLDHKITFPDYLRFEDPVFLVRAMYSAQQFAYTDKYLYCVRILGGVGKFNKRSVADIIAGIIDNLKIAYEWNLIILWARTLERLEYEYTWQILRCIQEGGDATEILQLLLEVNALVRDVKSDKAYVIRPLRLLADTMAQADYPSVIHKKLEQAQEIYLYGAGRMGQVVLGYLKTEHFSEKIKAFLVTETNGNKRNIQGIPVISLAEYHKIREKGAQALVLVAVCGIYQREIEEKLLEHDIENFELLNTVFLSELS